MHVYLHFAKQMHWLIVQRNAVEVSGHGQTAVDGEYNGIDGTDQFDASFPIIDQRKSKFDLKLDLSIGKLIVINGDWSFQR